MSKAELATAIRLLFVAFPSPSDVDATDAEIALAAYLLAIEGYDLVDVRTAVAMLVKGRVEGIAPQFRPTPPQLASACEVARDARLNVRIRDDLAVLPPRYGDPGLVSVHKLSPEFCALERHRGKTIDFVPSASGYYDLLESEFRLAMSAWESLPLTQRQDIHAAKLAAVQPHRRDDPVTRARGVAMLKAAADALKAMTPAKHAPTDAERAAALKKHDAFWGLPNRDDPEAAERRRRLDESLAAKQEPEREREPGEDEDEDDEREPQWWQK